MTSSARYNRVLLTEIGFMRPVSIKRSRGLVRDGSAFAYQIEELIALGAIQVAIQACPRNTAFRDSLSTKLRDRVRLIDDDYECQMSAKALLSPIAEELCLEFQGGVVSINKKLDEDVERAATRLYFYLQSFLLGVEHRLQIDIDLADMKASADLLRRTLRSLDGRAVASVLTGILTTYEPAFLSTAIVHPMAEQQLISLFKEFVQDETYKHLSEASHKIGIPRRAKRAVSMVGRQAKKLISKPAFREITDLSSKVIMMATQVPVPDSDAFNALVASGYLPPIVSLRKASQDAQAVWLAQKPDIVFPPSALNDCNIEDVTDRLGKQDETAQPPPERDK